MESGTIYFLIYSDQFLYLPEHIFSMSIGYFLAKYLYLYLKEAIGFSSIQFEN